MTATPVVQHFFDEETNTFSYVVTDPATQQCAIIDSVLNYDAAWHLPRLKVPTQLLAIFSKIA